MADKRDYYEVLGLQKGASDDEIKKAYRRIAKSCHPDLHPDDKEAEARFKEANEAYAILSDPEKKAKYDQFGFAGVDPNYGAGAGGFTGDFGDLGDIFGDIFGGFGFGGFSGGGSSARSSARSGPQRGESLRVRLTISFEEAAFGCQKEINIARIDQCPDCKGTGCAPGTTAEVCPDCKGTGTVRTQQRTAFGVFQSTAPCSRCGGDGKVIHTPCPKCRGNGSVRTQKKLSVSIPAGIDNGETVSLRGQGNAGKNGGPSGDLLVTVQVQPSPIFQREGSNLYMSTTLSFVQAALGAEIQVPTLEGDVSLNIPEGTQTGSVFRLRGKGVQSLRGGGRGDQYVTVNLETPKNLSAREKELLRELAECRGTTVKDKNERPFGKKKKK
ncbi:MAG: molecular chaperone DnaJ [Oscillospiraceae bacterium]